MTNSRFQKICRDVEKATTTQLNANGSINKPMPILAGLSSLTNGELDSLIFSYLESKFDLSRVEIKQLLSKSTKE